MDENFNMFLKTVDARFRSFISQLNEYLSFLDTLPEVQAGKLALIMNRLQ